MARTSGLGHYRGVARSQYNKTDFDVSHKMQNYDYDLMNGSRYKICTINLK